MDSLYESGVLFQSNYGSMIGQYGSSMWEVVALASADANTIANTLQVGDVIINGSGGHAGIYVGIVNGIPTIVDEKGTDYGCRSQPAADFITNKGGLSAYIRRVYENGELLIKPLI